MVLNWKKQEEENLYSIFFFKYVFIYKILYKAEITLLDLILISSSLRHTYFQFKQEEVLL